MSVGTSCERSRASIVTPTIMPKKAGEAEADADTAGVPEIQRHPREEVTYAESKPKRNRQEVLDSKRARLRRLLESEAIELENSLRAIGYGFISTQP